MSDTTNTETVTTQNDESVTLPEVEATTDFIGQVMGKIAALEGAVTTLTDEVTTLREANTTLKNECATLRAKVRQNEVDLTKNLKECVAQGVIDLDTAKAMAEYLGVDEGDLVSKFSVTLTLTVTVNGVVADSEDEAGDAVRDAIEANIGGYGVEYDDINLDDTSVDDVQPED